ncbi:hypothetical protein WJX72_008117 [[Myrmecia] bisecta]|uniref:Uncharacterized protein n=1 Tax=[Myrmecia] bisecta TaxID=41462 RepID=A0AAW1PHK6_9CHLO
MGHTSLLRGGTRRKQTARPYRPKQVPQAELKSMEAANRAASAKRALEQPLYKPYQPDRHIVPRETPTPKRAQDLPEPSRDPNTTKRGRDAQELLEDPAPAKKPRGIAVSTPTSVRESTYGILCKMLDTSKELIEKLKKEQSKKVDLFPGDISTMSLEEMTGWISKISEGYLAKVLL